MIDQVIWARAIVPFLVYDWSYILTFVFYFLRLQKDHVESKDGGLFIPRGAALG